jgi:hypothetical protein
MSQDEYFFRGLAIKGSTCCISTGGFNSYWLLFCREITSKFLLAFMITITKSKNPPETSSGSLFLLLDSP